VKQKFLLLITGLLLISCDPDVTYDYFVVNNCNEEIIVNITDLNNIKTEIQIPPYSEKHIYNNVIWGFVYVNYFFKEFVVRKNNINSNVNYINQDLWVIKESTRLTCKEYLTVNPEDFE